MILMNASYDVKCEQECAAFVVPCNPDTEPASLADGPIANNICNVTFIMVSIPRQFQPEIRMVHD
jgi:hypothetical protein